MGLLKGSGFLDWILGVMFVSVGGWGGGGVAKLVDRGGGGLDRSGAIWGELGVINGGGILISGSFPVTALFISIGD